MTTVCTLLANPHQDMILVTMRLLIITWQSYDLPQHTALRWERCYFPPLPQSQRWLRTLPLGQTPPPNPAQDTSQYTVKILVSILFEYYCIIPVWCCILRTRKFCHYLLLLKTAWKLTSLFLTVACLSLESSSRALRRSSVGGACEH